jgi:hypothetical protein
MVTSGTGTRPQQLDFPLRINASVSLLSVKALLPRTTRGSWIVDLNPKILLVGPVSPKSPSVTKQINWFSNKLNVENRHNDISTLWL